ncbi:MAG: ImmA/IrrE family metallo-endopeptidase [Gemmatimonadaceae bacterium]|nr:ImmA/IrrE family metallo-endopeptidase [Gemmatimonadaceae bacterium]
MPTARRLASLALLALLAAACAKEPPGYEGPYKRQVREAIPALEESSGLAFRALPVLQERSRDEIRTFVEQQFNEQMTPLEFAGAQQAYRLFGLLPDTLDLRKFFIDLLTEQVAGYYDPATKVLYVNRDASPEIREVTITHELMHALQDQHTRLDSVQTLKGDNDRMVAMQAVIEGQATYEQIIVMTDGNDLSMRIPGGWDRVRETIRSAQASMPRFANAPMLIQETLLFPYLSGAEFIRQFKRARSGQTPFTPFAASTEQILHPDKYLSDTPDLPTRVTLAPPRLGALLHEDGLGEFEVRLLVFEHLKHEGTAVAAGMGWDGDRYQVIETPAGPALGWVTVWDSPVEAAEFRDIMGRVVARRLGLEAAGAGPAPGPGGTQQWTGRGRRVTLEARTIDGRPVVVMEDAPAGVAGRLLAVDRVHLQEP